MLAAGLSTLAAAPVALLLGSPVAAAAALAALAFALLLAAHNVPPAGEAEDEAAARRLMAAAGRPSLARPRGFAAEVDLAYLVQQAVFDVAPFEKRDPDGRKVALPMGRKRELSDLIAAGSGYCFDRSRAIETILRLHGLEVRHAALFSTAETGSALRSLVTRDVGSHALSEMRTERGWMAIDSNFRFVGVSADGEVFDMAGLRAFPDARWDSRNREIGPKLTRPFTWIYGLYSRHGRFYPPYTPFPNVNWRELLYNFGR